MLTVKKLLKIYDNGSESETMAVDGIDLTVDSAEFIALSGPSGSGKTSFLNLLGGLDQPDSGDVIFLDQKISQLKEPELSKIRLHQIGFVFQAHNLIPVLTAMENIEYILMLQGVNQSDRRHRVTEIAKRLGIGDLLHKRPNQMSGGQEQRVAVARAIVSKPPLILADEPTANLDSKTADQLMHLMQQLNQEYQITFIFSTHDLQVMERAKRNLHLQDGQIVSDEHRSS